MQDTSGIANYDSIVSAGNYSVETKLVINNVEGNQQFPLEDLPDPSPGSDSVSDGVLFVTHPNTRVTVYRIAV